MSLTERNIRPRNRKVRQVDVLLAEKQRQALELRRAGATYVQIANALGYKTHVGAMKAVQSGLKRTLQEPADDVRALELGRLDVMIMGVWPRARQGDDAAIRSMLRIMERRAAYLGLDAPVKREITLQDYTTRAAEKYGLDPKDVLLEAERIIAELAG